MSLDFSGLTDLAKDPVKATTGWQPLRPEDLGEGMVLFFDQSLTATGWVKVVSTGGLIGVAAAGKIPDNHKDRPRGVDTDLRRAVTVFEHAYVLIDGAVGVGYEIAHESPPHAGNVKGGGTSSLASAVAVRNAAALASVEIEMLGAQPAKKLVCGSAKATKAEAHAVLRETCFPWIEGTKHVTNEATRDALMGALLWLYRRKK